MAVLHEHIEHEREHDSGGNILNLIVGLIVILLVLYAFFVYIYPSISGRPTNIVLVPPGQINVPAPQINVPAPNIDVPNISTPSPNTPTPTQ